MNDISLRSSSQFVPTAWHMRLLADHSSLSTAKYSKGNLECVRKTIVIMAPGACGKEGLIAVIGPLQVTSCWFPGSGTAVPWQCHDSAMGIQWQCNSNAMAVP